MNGKAEWGSDVVVEMMQRYGIEYAPTNLGATFRGLLDSVINFGGNKTPEIIECLHEEIAVSIAHGYARVTGKPLVALVHNVVGTLHAAMAVYNAFVDRAPMIIMSGTGPMSLKGRRPWIDWVHTALVQGNLVREYVKWDDQPHDPESVPESFMRGYRVSMTEPKGPVYLALDAGWQEAKLSEPVPLPDISQFLPPAPVQGDPESLRKTAEALSQARAPLIIADRVGRNPEAVRALVELAETGAISVIDQGGALNFPNTHPLDATGSDALAESDVVLLLDVSQVEAALSTSNRYTREIRPRVRTGARIIDIGLSDLWIRSTMVDYGRLYPVEMTIAADTSRALPEITAELKKILERERQKKEAVSKRLEKTRETRGALRKKFEAEIEKEAAKKPISHALLARETWKLVEGEKWIVAGARDAWIRRLWKMDRPGSVLGGQGAAALGSSMPKAIGAGLAAKKDGGFCVAFQTDGDLLYVPSSIWTAVHHHIPMLVILLDNGGYIGEGEHVAWTSRSRGRSTEQKQIATEIKNPSVDFASLARAQGAYAEGPIEEPKDVGPALARAFQVMKEKQTFAMVWVKIA